MPRWVIYACEIFLLMPLAASQSADLLPAYIQNEDSHPHQVSPGNSARFSLEPGPAGARMDVKCSLEGDNGEPLSAVTLRTRGLVRLRWPYTTRTIRIDNKIDFDITAETQPRVDEPVYFEFVNGDESRLLWHQCYNN